MVQGSSLLWSAGSNHTIAAKMCGPRRPAGGTRRLRAPPWCAAAAAATAIRRTIWPGRGEITNYFVGELPASSMLCVTKITVLGVSIHKPLEIAAQLLAGHGIERAERLVIKISGGS